MSLKRFFYDWIVPILVAIVFTLLVNKFIFFNVKIPSESMYPTIKIGDRAMVTKIYNYSNLKRGSVVVFESREIKDPTTGKDETLIKRLIGLPGDKIDVKEDNSVWVNGTKLDEPYVKNPGGKTGSFKVPAGSYFFMGDNRTSSFDSRYWKQPYIPQSDITGKAQIIIFPFDRFGKLK